MKTHSRAIVIVAAMAGLMTGCASPAPKACKQCTMSGSSDKVSCGTKNGCSKAGCRAKGNCGAKSN